MPFDDLVSPEERVRSRKQALDQFINVAQPALASQQAYDRQNLKRNVMAKTAQGMGGSVGAGQVSALGTMGQAAEQGTQLLGQQAQQQQTMNVAGAQMQQQIAAAKNAQSVANVQRGLNQTVDNYARIVADRAFQEGLSAKQLIFHTNSQLADYSMEKLKADFEAGRVSKFELQNLLQAQQLRLKEKQIAADKAFADYMGNFKKDLAAGNAEKAKARLVTYVQAQKDLAKDGVRAQNTASILEGITQAASVAAQKIFT